MLLIGVDGSRKFIRIEEGEKFPYEELQKICGSKITRKHNIGLDFYNYNNSSTVYVVNDCSGVMMEDKFNSLATAFAKHDVGADSNEFIMFFGDVVLMNLWDLDEKSCDKLKKCMKNRRGHDAAELAESQQIKSFWDQHGD